MTRHMRPAKLVYPLMSLKQIEQLPVYDLADEGAHVWLWAVNQLMPEAYDVMKRWGIKYHTTVTWRKPSGLGNYFINHTEHILFGYKNKCEFNKARYIPNAYDTLIDKQAADLWNEWGRPRKHSAKPVGSYQLIESVSDAPRLEMFARPITPLFGKMNDWDTWGNELPNEVELALKETA